jgi:D-ribose pyranase
VASIGHLDEITIADACLAAPSGVAVIDLAVSPGIPSFFDVVSALGLELVIEGVVEAEGASGDLKARFAEKFLAWETSQNRPVGRLEIISHAAFKERTKNSKAIIRTGETIPFCNVILIAAVAF